MGLGRNKKKLTNDDKRSQTSSAKANFRCSLDICRGEMFEMISFLVEHHSFSGDDKNEKGREKEIMTKKHKL